MDFIFKHNGEIIWKAKLKSNPYSVGHRVKLQLSHNDKPPTSTDYEIHHIEHTLTDESENFVTVYLTKVF